MKICALIPCRQGSKGIKGKNTKKLLHGKPLWRWSAEVALEAGIFDKIIVSTDGSLTQDDLPVEFDYHRPEELSTSEARLDDVILHYQACSLIDQESFDMWCLLQPTSPLRLVEDILGAYKMAQQEKYDSVVSVYPHPILGWVDKAIVIHKQKEPIALYHYNNRPNRQHRKSWFLENGAVYFTKTYVLDMFKCRLGGSIGLYKMPRWRSPEIDDIHDWELCEWLMAKNGGLYGLG